MSNREIDSVMEEVDIISNKIKNRLTDDDLDKLAGVVSLGLHLAQSALTKMKHEYSRRYDGSAEYRRVCKTHGKIFADHAVECAIIKSLYGDDRNKVGQIIKAIERVEYLMDALSDSTIQASYKSDGVDDMKIYDIIHNNVEYWEELFLRMSNFTSPDDFIKINSAVKLYAKGDNVSDRIFALIHSQM